MPVRRSLAALVVAVPLVTAAVVGATSLRPGSDDPAASEVVDLRAVDEVEGASVADLVALADCALLGEVTDTRRGRVVAPGLVSRLVTVRIDEALAGDCPSGTVVVEEEGWLDDGTEVSVEGWPGSTPGDVGVWFLVAGASDELPYAATVSTLGAPRWRDGRFVAPSDTPPWLLAAADGGPEALAGRVRALG